jgi:RNA polymerase sigma-70 factor (ECF subfamily)
MIPHSVPRRDSQATPAHAASTPDPAGDEQALVARIRDGDRAAFEVVFDRYAAQLVAFARAQVGSTAVAEEIVQDVFFAVWMGRERWIVRRSVRAYLCQAVHNRALNYHRDHRDEQQRLDSIDAASAAERCEAPERADDRLTNAELRQAIHRAMATLPEKNRQVFHLVRRQQLTYPEVAEVLGISVKSVEAHVHRAAHALRELLAGWRP